MARTTTEQVKRRGRECIRQLTDAGSRRGFRVETEYAVPGGRIDVVWLLRPAEPIPGVEDSLPLVGFEVESSARSRKHVKGDFLNLLALQASLGVIVMLGNSADVESVRRYAIHEAGRWWGRILVWSEKDVAALLSGRELVEPPPGKASPMPPGVVSHTGKYRALWAWLTGRPEDRFKTSFGEIEDILGFALPPSSRSHDAHWYGYKGTAVGRAIRDAGWRARSVDRESETVTFERLG
jgi:hypothetical protein